MPGIAAARELTLAIRARDLIEKTFQDSKVRADAFKLYALAKKGGETSGFVIAALYFFMSVVFFILVPILGLLVLLGTILFTKWFSQGRKKAQEDYNDLVGSNPDYWTPIVDKLKEIALEAGHFDEGWGTIQFSSITNK